MNVFIYTHICKNLNYRLVKFRVVWDPERTDRLHGERRKKRAGIWPVQQYRAYSWVADRIALRWQTF